MKIQFTVTFESKITWYKLLIDASWNSRLWFCKRSSCVVRSRLIKNYIIMHYKTLQQARNYLELPSSKSTEDFGFITIRLSLLFESSRMTIVFSRLSQSWMWIKIRFAVSIQSSITLSVRAPISWVVACQNFGGIVKIIVWRCFNLFSTYIYKTSESAESSQRRMGHT